MRGSFLVYFEGPFWVGVVERETDDGYEVARVVFGSEPTAAELVVWAREHYRALAFRRVDAAGEVPRERRRNPKRAQREAQRAAAQRGPSTRSQAALAEAHAACKQERVARSRAERDAEEARRWEISRAKRKAKQRGH